MPLARWIGCGKRPRPAGEISLEPWRISEDDFPAGGTRGEQIRFLLRYAILAPSSHNSQPWRFSVSDRHVDVFMDKDRWLTVADADRRELRLSIGCALENLLIAAEHFGLKHDVAYFPEPGDDDLAATVRFDSDGSPSSVRPPVLFEMIAARRTSHMQHDGRSISEDVQKRLRECCVEEGIYLYLTSAVATKRRIDELIMRADLIQFADPAFRRELAYWIGEGVFGTSRLMSKLLKMAVARVNLGRSQSRRDSALVMSSPVFGIFGSSGDDRTTQIRMGQVFERMCLLAASMDLWTQPMSQIVELPELRDEVAQIIPERNIMPEHPFRLGYAAPPLPTPRRPLEQVIE